MGSMSALKQAKTLLAAQALCDACLGRQFANLSHGLSNAERGRALRVTLCLNDDVPFEQPELCPLCLNHFARVEAWAQRVYERLLPYEFERYLIGTRAPQFLVEAEDELRQRHHITTGEPWNRSFNRAVGRRLGEVFQEQQGRLVAVDFRQPEVVVQLDLTWEKATLQINPIYLFGRYKKFKRGIPQTHWPCKACKGKGCKACNGSGAQYPESVESLLGERLKRRCQAQSYVLHGAGREDIDARMLGTGRPFVLELKQPRKRPTNWEALAAEVNAAAQGKVEVMGLTPVGTSMVGAIKTKKAQKRYRVVVAFERCPDQATLDAALNALLGTIEQRTPQRVAHRRADLVRKRELFQVEGKLLDAQTAEITLLGAGGLYIKELISGDGGRTAPSLAAKLGTNTTVTELDVLDILGKFL